MSLVLAAVLGGLAVAAGWLAHAVVLHRQLGTWRTDPVTGLPVRREFYRHTHRALRRPTMVLLLIDLDRFKPINDTYGHHIGDQILAVVGTRLRTGLGPAAVLGRLGGDEFAAVVPAGPAGDSASALLTRLHQALAAPITLTDLPSPVEVGASIGAVHLDRLRRPALSAVLQLAEEQMYRAKRAGGGVATATADPRDPRLAKPANQRPAHRRRDDRHQPQ